MVSITITTSAKPPSFARSFPLTLQLAGDATISDVKAAIAKEFPKFGVHRQKLTLKGERKALSDDSRLVYLGLGDGDELHVKDLGTQVSWSTVFVTEYAGPLIIHPLIWSFPKVFYGQTVEHSPLQKCLFAMVLVHFVKRELETLYVHRFSHATMPVFNLLKNSAHYWLLSGVLLAYSLYSPTYSSTSSYVRGTVRDDPGFLIAGVVSWTFFELSNLWTHIALRKLRPSGSKKRGIPYGYGFSVVSCPNYSFEILAWVVVCAMSGSWSAWLFTVAATVQMTLWALKKHRAYKKEFGSKYPRGRKALVPFLI